MKRLLMIAFHFPPLAGSSGVQRCLRFAQYLPEFGWEPLVLTAHPRAYEHVAEDLQSQIPPGLVVRRAQAFDAARHFALGGRYPGALACPDRWVSWRFDGVRTGMAMIEQWQPAALWSTYPIATAHVIGAELARRSGLPWIADCRDPMAQDGYPADPRIWRAFAAIERRMAAAAAACTFTSPTAARTYAARYPEAAARMRVIENGYDESSFVGIDDVPRAPLHDSEFTLLHSGIVYPSERDPTQLFAALGHLRATRPALMQRLRLRFRGAVHNDLLHRLAVEHGVADRIETLPPIAYQDALMEMVRADGLLLLQAANCNEQIPAKLYEYLRCRRPILGLTDSAGDTAAALRNAGLRLIAPLDDAPRIAAAIEQLIAAPDTSSLPSDAAVRTASRYGHGATLAALLDATVAQAGDAPVPAAKN
jgi:glycosyltransferase involved in cell wall biosynthesis